MYEQSRTQRDEGARCGSIHQEAYPGYMILLIGLAKLQSIHRENV